MQNRHSPIILDALTASDIVFEQPLLILPLFTPFLIFGVGAMAASPGAFEQGLLFLGALSLFSLAAMPFAAALALRAGLE